MAAVAPKAPSPKTLSPGAPPPDPRSPGVVGTSYLGSVHCGRFANERIIGFAPPPSEPVVVSVGLSLWSDVAKLGSLTEFLGVLQQEFGEPVAHTTEPLDPPTTAEHYAWLFPGAPNEVPCVALAPTQSNGQALTAGIPPGATCMTH